MKKNLKIAIPLFALASGLIVGSAFAVSSAIKNNQEHVLKSEYFMNDTVYVGRKQIDCDGVMKTASCRVKSPSGKEFAVKDSFITDEFGKYEVTYSATNNGLTYSLNESFITVRQAVDLFTLSSDNLTDAKLEQGLYLYDTSYYGVRATISSGASLYFNQTIDFNDLSMDLPIFSMIIEPHAASGGDCSLLEFAFTDVDDPSNVMTITYAAGDNYGYIRSGKLGQDQRGWQNYSDSAISKCHVNQFGNPSFTSFDRATCQSKNNNYPLKTFYEANLNQLYVSRTRCFPWGTTPSFVVDYDDLAVWGENIWKGFTNGKATLKITPKQTISANTTLLFTSIYKYDFNESKFIDTEAPTITVDKIASGNVAPQAKVGEPYNLFNCSAFDGYDGVLEHNVEVKYVNPTNQARSDVEIKNNSFVPNIPGVYEIVYSATDFSGNSNTKVVNVVASNNVSDLIINLNDNDKTSEIFQDVNILPASDAVVSGGSGEARIFRTIYAPNGRTINTDENYITLEDVGDYKVVYEAIDYLGHHGAKTITITSTNREKPKIMGTFSFPDALLKGFEYDIPKLYAKECTDDGVITKEAVVLINGKQYTEPSFVAEGESVRIQYVAKGSTGKEERITNEYIVKDGEDGKRQDNYFLCEDSEVVLERNYVEYKTTKTTNKTSFINKINSRSFTLIFNYDFNTFKASGVKVTLEDETRTHSYTMDVAIGKTDCKLTYPGCVNQPTVATQFDNGVNKMRLSYNSAKGTVTDIDSNVLCAVTKDDNGKPFAGFNGYVYLTISIVDPDPVAGSKIMLERLSNQTLGYRAKDASRAEDTISPEIYLDYEFNRKQTIGSTFIVPKALSCDILNPIDTFTVEMYSRYDDGKVKETILSKDDASIEHSVKLDKFDNYLIKYTSVDKAGNEVIATRLLYVIENQPPLLEVNYSNIKKVYNVGDAVGIPTFKITDNSDHCVVNVYVFDPHSRMYLLQNTTDGITTSILTSDKGLYDSNFIVDELNWRALIAGEYKFKVVAYDSCYNYSFSEYTFYVKSN